MAVEQHQMPADATERMAAASREEAQADNTGGDQKPGRPEWLQEKFQSPEDLAKAYDELERKLGSKPAAPVPEQQKPAQEQQVPTQEQPDTPNVQPGEALLPGLDNNIVEEMSNYAWENHSLTDEHYQQLEAAGYSRQMVDSYMQGQFAVQADHTNALLEAGGGEQQVEGMFAWAQQNLNEQQIAAYDEMFDRGGPEAIMAMENLRAKYENSGFASYQQITGANAPSYGTGTFQTTADVLEAMGDPRYKTNPAYREEVARKLAQSNVLNNGRA